MESKEIVNEDVDFEEPDSSLEEDFEEPDFSLEEDFEDFEDDVEYADTSDSEESVSVDGDEALEVNLLVEGLEKEEPLEDELDIDELLETEDKLDPLDERLEEEDADEPLDPEDSLDPLEDWLDIEETELIELSSPKTGNLITPAEIPFPVLKYNVLYLSCTWPMVGFGVPYLTIAWIYE